MKFCFAILILILPVLSARGEDKHTQEFNAYRIVFLDGDSKPVVTATVFAPSISPETKRQEATAFIEELENKNQVGPAKTLQQILTPGTRQVVITGIPADVEKKQPAMNRIDFTPGMFDANIDVKADMAANPITGTWGYSVYSGGGTGGKVRITRVHARKQEVKKSTDK
jgi:hypothetical protein